MTANEVEFSLRVEEMLSSIKRPEFRQSIVEVSYSIVLFINLTVSIEMFFNRLCFSYVLLIYFNFSIMGAIRICPLVLMEILV